MREQFPFFRSAVTADRPQSAGEEIANSISHGAGFVAAAAILPVLIVNAIPHGAAAVVGAAVFGSSVALLYLASTLYHAIAPPRAKGALRIVDHASIYVLIAGTYTPFTLGALRGPWGWSLFGVTWGLALAGILLKSVRGISHPRLSTIVYLAMGWLVLAAVKPLVTAVPGWGLFWLVAGGVAYTAGVAFYAAPRVRYSHFVWHLFVLAGTGCHVVAVLNYAA